MMAETSVIRLSARLQAAAALIPQCSTLFDIGTDHAYLPIYCIQMNRCQHAVASDRREGPLRRATEHIKRYQLAELITTRLTDGLSGLNPQVDDTVVICGLGGVEMQRILAAGGPVSGTLILQPQKDIRLLRHWLADHGYVFESEYLAEDRNRYYPVMRVRHDGKQHQLTELEAQVGPCLIRTHTPALRCYISRELGKLNKQLTGTPELGPLIDLLNQLMEDNEYVS